MSRPMLNSEMVLNLFSSRHIFRAEYFCHRNGKVREIHLMKLVMFLWDPTPKPHPAPHKELPPITMQLISHLRHHNSGAPFLLIQALPSSREDTRLCTCLQNSRHASGATKISVYKPVPKDDLGYKVPSSQTREYDIYCCLDILHSVQSVFGQGAEKGPTVKIKHHL